jgi:mannonate dehydratase
MVYGHANGNTLDETISQAKHYKEMGYLAIRLQSGVPGLASAYGVSKDKLYYEPADAALPTENAWSTIKYLPTVPKLFEAARETLGWDVHLLHDVHHRLTPIEAGRLGKDLEPYRPFWLEDCTPAENQEAFRLIRQHTTTPLAVGEIFNSVWDSRSLIEEQLIDYIRSAICHAGGITHMRTIAALAGLHQVRTGFHGATDLSPVTFGAAVHFDIWVPNFGIQEHMPHEAATMEVFSHDHRFEDGYLIVSDAPGHGVDIDEEAAARYDYQPAYLPVNRLTDGTLWDW